MTYPYIRHSRSFYGKFEVVLRNEIIPCHNLGTARAIVAKIKAGT